MRAATLLTLLLLLWSCADPAPALGPDLGAPSEDLSTPDVSPEDAAPDLLADLPAEISPEDLRIDPEDALPPSDASPGDLAPEPDSPQDAPAEDLAPQDVPAEDLPPEDLPVEDLAPQDQGVPDLGPMVDVPASAWRAGAVVVPAVKAELLPLPGGGQGGPVVTSNNPEAFDGPGLLFGTARPTQTRGGERFPLEGEFGVYFHHLNRGQAPLWVTLMVTNPNPDPVTVEAYGDAWTQDEAGGVGLGTSPDYRVSEGWLLGPHRTRIEPTAVPSLRPLRIWSGQLSRNREVDGRFGIIASAPVYVYVVASETNDLNDALRRGLEDAPGDYRISGDPPPPFGREAGVYAHDRWWADFRVAVPAGTARVGWAVNTATGAGFTQVQAFPALTHYAGSAREAVGMYGNLYDLRLTLLHDGADARPRRVRVSFQSLVTAQLSRYWDGAARVNGAPAVIRHVPGAASTTLFEGELSPGQEQVVHFEAMVPGLTSIPQALTIESR